MNPDDEEAEPFPRHHVLLLGFMLTVACGVVIGRVLHVLLG